MPEELLAARQWVAAKFEGVATPGLEVVSNYDAVEKNSRFGQPLQIGDTRYTRGLFCHAPSKIIVHLPSPGKTFTAVAGLDANGCKGSVVFSVTVGGNEAFKSDLMKQGMSQPVNVALSSATDFTLGVSDGGDGISCDQSDWADAQVTLLDGTTLWLADLPFVGGPANSDPAEPFFSFTYGGRPSADLLKTWKRERASQKLDDGRIQRTLTWTDPTTGLIVRCVGVEYVGYPTVEWTLYFKNGSTEDTPILEGIQAFDQGFQHGRILSQYVLHHFVGSPTSQSDYAPIHTPLLPKSDRRIGASGGLPAGTDMPYFSLETPVGKGAIIAVGWPGQWSSQWTRDETTGLRVKVGQELTHLKLLPGEEIRTPLMVLQFWSGGDWIRAQNIWRKWMLAHNVPKPNGTLPDPELFGCSAHLTNEMCNANEANQKMYLDRFLEERIKIGHWWMDAGWYPCGDPPDWGNTGTWEVDKTRFPGGLKAISDYAHARGVKTILWFDPEMVRPKSWLAENHPEWVLGEKGNGLLDLGNPAALSWLTKHISKLMTDEGIDLYRQDMNFDPLPYWRANDTEDRQGITENKHIVGYLAFWDYLLKQHPDMFIDSCASGGRRNDLETMRRAIPLWRTDWRCEPVGTQCATYGISFWLPLSGTGAADINAYVFRSNMAPFTNCLLNNLDRTQNWDLFRKLTSEWQQISAYYIGDYWPLTPFSTENDIWMAWQFDRPDLGAGMVQAFRRGNSTCAAIGFQLKQLDPNATYAVTNMDVSGLQNMTGQELMEKYLLIEIIDKPGAALYTYRKVR
jgi:alpha-galactosidase